MFLLFFLQHCSIDSSQGVLEADLQELRAKMATIIATASKLIFIKFFLMILVSDAFDETKKLNVTANLVLKLPFVKGILTRSAFSPIECRKRLLKCR